MALTPADITAIARADAQYVETALARLTMHFTTGAWLGSQNRYRRDCLAALPNSRSSSAVSHLDLAEYIAAACILHCMDGWSYLGRALNCHARGDSCNASHLGYYAELRAALSILASQGIGIFGNSHFVVDSVGICDQIPNNAGTHKMVWWVLKHWAQQQQSAKALGKMVSPAGIPLDDWLLAFNGISSLRLIGKDMLTQWGFDLDRMSRGDEQRARNILSYQPTSIAPRSYLDAEQSAEFIVSVWSLCQPLVSSRFEMLDRHLLRESLRTIFLKNMTGISTSLSYRTRVQNALTALPFTSQTERERLELFLTTDPSKTSPLLNHARGTTTPEDPNHHVQVMARSVLLLRVATGLAADLLRAVSISASDVEFWWRPIGESRALWRPGQDPADVMDLWDDVEAALDDASEWTNRQSGSSVSFAQWWDEQAATISTLQGCERIAFWGLGL